MEICELSFNYPKTTAYTAKDGGTLLNQCQRGAHVTTRSGKEATSRTEKN